VICGTLYPQVSQSSYAVISSPPNQQPAADLDALTETLNQVSQRLATQLLRLTDLLERCDPTSKEYDDQLGRVQRMIETINLIRK